MVIVPVNRLSRLTEHALCEARSLGARGARRDRRRRTGTRRASETPTNSGDSGPCGIRGCRSRCCTPSTRRSSSRSVALIDEIRERHDEQIVVLIPVVVPRQAPLPVPAQPDRPRPLRALGGALQEEDRRLFEGAPHPALVDPEFLDDPGVPVLHGHAPCNARRRHPFLPPAGERRRPGRTRGSLPDLELRSVDARRARAPPPGGPARRRRRPPRRRGPARRIGTPSSAASAHGRHERHLAEQRHLELGRQLLAAAGAEQLVARAVVAGEPRHVLDNAAHRELELLAPRRPSAGRRAGRRPAGW